MEDYYDILNMQMRGSGIALGSQNNSKIFSNIIALVLSDDLASFVLD